MTNAYPQALGGAWGSEGVSPLTQLHMSITPDHEWLVDNLISLVVSLLLFFLFLRGGVGCGKEKAGSCSPCLSALPTSCLTMLHKAGIATKAGYFLRMLNLIRLWHVLPGGPTPVPPR